MNETRYVFSVNCKCLVGQGKFIEFDQGVAYYLVEDNSVRDFIKSVRVAANGNGSFDSRPASEDAVPEALRERYQKLMGGAA